MRLPTRIPLPRALVVLPAILLGFGVPASAQTLQELINAAQPGDTVWVAPGTYRRAVSVNEDIVIKGQGDGVYLVGLVGSLARVEDLTFDGSLDLAENPLVQAGTGLEILRCRFVNAVVGVFVADGAAGVHIDDCVLDGVYQGVSLSEQVQSLSLTGTQLLDCLFGVLGASGFVCIPGPSRSPADRCSSGCGVVSMTDVLIQGGDHQIQLSGNYRLVITDSKLREGVVGITGTGLRLEMKNSVLTPGATNDTGIDLQVSSGFIQGSQISGWDVAIRIGDGGCPLYSDIVLGGSLDAGNDISGDTWSLQVEQPEALDANYNFWGTTDCANVLSAIDGQKVGWIANSFHNQAISCSGTPVVPTRWGTLKTRYRQDEGEGNR